VIVELGKTEARLPRREQSKLESFQIGERIRAVILQVEKASRGPQVVISRADAALVSRLFEMEVPEIYDGTVVVRAVAREAGERTKIAVLSKDRDVDCVGACVGMKGMRVQSIIRELRGEKIDIVEYNEDPSAFTAHALSPAKINRVTVLDPMAKHMEVIVDDTQLSLAIGKKGQNVRLASKLLGWRIDIKSEEEKRQDVETQMEQLMPAGTPLTEVAGIGAKTTEKLIEHGITTVERLGEMTPEQLQEIPGIGPKMVEKIRLAINNYYMQFEEPAGETVEAVAETEAQPTEAAFPAEEAVVETPTEQDRTKAVAGAEAQPTEAELPAEEAVVEIPTEQDRTKKEES
ncbi:MAG: transcription termination factor NusA, partial [Acidobacteria bacterium RIFCSPLOWO2_02_FULL_59_13]